MNSLRVLTILDKYYSAMILTCYMHYYARSTFSEIFSNNSVASELTENTGETFPRHCQ